MNQQKFVCVEDSVANVTQFLCIQYLKMKYTGMHGWESTSAET